jgi:hypothetical protein
MALTLLEAGYPFEHQLRDRRVQASQHFSNTWSMSTVYQPLDEAWG